MLRPSRILDRAKTLRAANELAFTPELRMGSRRSTVESLIDDVFPLAIEASRRAHGLEHYPVQVLGGIELVNNRIIEMQTGEGKTLTAILPVAAHALAGRGCHVLTANDYLAKRDAEFAAPILSQLGLTVGVIQSDMEDYQRTEAYLCDVTYGTGTEMGFDFLRDRLRLGPRSAVEEAVTGNLSQEPLVQRGHHYALVDEADHLLIDDATTPLLIALEQEEPEARHALYHWADGMASELTPEMDYEFDHERREAYLTNDGLKKVTLRRKSAAMVGQSMEDIFGQVETSIIARLAFAVGRDYVVNDDEITIVSESTGRQLEGRKWQRGLHFAVEAKERVPFGKATGTAAQISVQSYFGLYRNLAGMTGTAWNARKELKKYYKSRVRVIPTHRPCIRTELPTRVFVDITSKNLAIAEEIQEIIGLGRAVLVGTPSVTASQQLSDLLQQQRVEHVVLNAVQHEHEADIVSRAGEPRRVTIATNMAGRGTDIVLDDSVRSAGGLHVIATEMHASARIDRQLVGRAARQGDPGSYRFMISLQDELFRHAPDKQSSLQRRAARRSGQELPGRWASYFKKVQRLAERQSTRARKLAFDAAKTQRKEAAKVGLDVYLEMTTDE